MQHIHLVNRHTRSYLAYQADCACATYQVSFYIFIEILTTDIIFMTKDFYWLFQIRLFSKIIFRNVIEDTSVEFENRVHWHSLMLYFLLFLALFSSRKKWLSCLSYAISPHLHAKMINWTSSFYLSFSCMVLPKILNLLIFMNRVISITCICQFYFMLFYM